MVAFHSDDAFDRLKTLPVVKGKEGVEPNTVTKNYRAFRKELVRKTSPRKDIFIFPEMASLGVREGGLFAAFYRQAVRTAVHFFVKRSATNVNRPVVRCQPTMAG